MIKITRTFYVSKDDLGLITNNIPSKDAFTFHTTYVLGTSPVELTMNLPEEFRVTEDDIQTILEGLFPALDEQAIEVKAELIKNHLRSVGARL